ncbi:MAG: hypothetical protein V1850_02750 [Candidatus Bathyarchaeota archaeon]
MLLNLIRRILARLIDNLTFWRGFGWGVIGLAIAAWYLQGLYSQLTSTGFSWMFFIQFSFTFITFSWLLGRASILGARNILYSIALVFGLNAVGDTVWIVLNDAFVRHIFDNGFRIGWFVSPHMSRNLILSTGLLAYFILWHKGVARIGKIFLASVLAYGIFWVWYVSVGCPDWRQPATLNVLSMFQAFLLQQFVFRIFANIVFTTPFIHLARRNENDKKKRVRYLRHLISKYVNLKLVEGFWSDCPPRWNLLGLLLEKKYVDLPFEIIIISATLTV